MERLTEKVLGHTQIKDCGNDFCKETCAEHDEEKSCNNCPIQKAIEKLAEYEDLEEQGKLLKLPCAVGDAAYRINKGAEEPIIQMTVTEVVTVSTKTGAMIVWVTCRDADFGEILYIDTEFGKKVFFSREEAEIYLEKREAGRC